MSDGMTPTGKAELMERARKFAHSAWMEHILWLQGKKLFAECGSCGAIAPESLDLWQKERP